MAKESLIIRRYVSEILSYVNDNRGCNVSDIKEEYGTSAKINSIIDEMIDAELISCKRGDVHNTKYLYITSKGRTILRLITRIEEYL